jgi:glycosyltransferase involved in cell wall biosynthesis
MTGVVSVIIPVFNAERFVREAIDSVFAQTGRPLEIIVVDDGSTDGTANAVRACEEAEVRYVAQANAGPQVARNHGVRLAQGDFIAFLDADDIWEPAKLEVQLTQFAENAALDCSFTRTRLFWEPELKEDEARHRASGDVEVDGFCFSTMLVRRSLFDRVGPFDPELKHAGAGDWFGRARELGARIESVEAVLVRRRLHAANLSRNARFESRDEWLNMAAELLRRKRQERGGA